MRTLTTTLLLFALLPANAQIILSDNQIREKTDSILNEANLLYKYEKAAWVSTDIAFENETTKHDIRGYLVYQQGDTINSIILNQSFQCILETAFINGLSNPVKENFNKRTLYEYEIHLLLIRDSIIKDIDNKKLDITCPDDFNLNFVMIPTKSGYKLYILTGTSQSGIIPFGNDYLVISDGKGEILSWKKFHSRLIATPIKAPNGEEAIEYVHSHLKTEPFISATDICTFKLYAPLYYKLAFTVYSPALSKSFRYLLLEDKIEIHDGL